PRPVPPVKRQVYGAEKVGELLGPGPVIGHAISVPTSRSIVNPDGSAVPGPRLRLAGRVRLAGCGRYARSLVWIGETLPAAGHPRRGRGGRQRVRLVPVAVRAR